VKNDILGAYCYQSQSLTWSTSRMQLVFLPILDSKPIPRFSVKRCLHSERTYGDMGFWGWEIGNKVRNLVWGFVYGGHWMDSEFVPRLHIIGCRRRLLVESL